MKFILIATAVSTLAGCSSVPRAMSGRIGCPASDIEILDSSPGFGLTSSTWVASCGDRKFYCSLGPDSKDVEAMACAESLPSRGPFFPEEFDLLSEPEL